MAASDFADWWDSQKQETETILTEWVQDNPQWWTVVIAATVQTTMDVGAGFVDVLRLGEGAAEGGFSGYGKDALRVLALAGPLARAGGMANRFLTPLLRSGRIRLAVQVAGVDGPCTFQAVNNATSIAKGKNLFVTVADMAKAAGKNLGSLKVDKFGDYKLAAWVDDLVPFLRSNGVRVKEILGLNTVQEVIAIAQKETGPVIFAIKATVRTATDATEEILHSVIATRTPGGAVRFADYGNKFVKSLPDLLRQWGTPVSDIELLQSGSSATIIEGARITGEIASKLAKGAIVILEGIQAIETEENGVEMAVPATMAATNVPFFDDPASPEVVKGSFEAFKARKSGKSVIQLPTVYVTAGRKTAPRPDWLTGVQFRLNALGFAAGPVDGINGPRTIKAVTQFQRAYPPLKVDGIPGPRTQAKLCDVCGY